MQRKIVYRKIEKIGTHRPLITFFAILYPLSTVRKADWFRRRAELSFSSAAIGLTLKNELKKENKNIYF